MSNYCESCKHLEYHGFRKGRAVNTIYTWCSLIKKHIHPKNYECSYYSAGEPKRME